MKVTKTVELNNDEVLTVEKFLAIADKIADCVPNRSMEDVFHYFVNDTKVVGEHEFNLFSNMVKLDEI